MFAEAAEWNLWDETAGDFRLKVEDGYAEIYGTEEKQGTRRLLFQSFLRNPVFDSEMEEISFVPEPKLKTLREEAGLSQSQLSENPEWLLNPSRSMNNGSGILTRHRGLLLNLSRALLSVQWKISWIKRKKLHTCTMSLS